MTTHPIVAELLGHAVEAAGAREVASLTASLRRFSSDDWKRTAMRSSDVEDVVAHLATGAAGLATAWRRRLDPEPVTLQHPIHDPSTDEAPTDVDPEGLLISYREAVHDLLAALGTCRTDDWSWPVWSPLGGTETLASAARRWVAHHRVHHHDILAAVGRLPEPDGDTEDLVSEFVLDAMVRRGGNRVPAPLTVEVQVSPPGAGTWTMIFEPEEESGDLPPLWLEIVAPSEARPHQRIERGTNDTARVIVRTDGETLWRAAFQRGADFADMDVHGDDAGRAMWQTLVQALRSTERRIGQVQA